MCHVLPLPPTPPFPPLLSSIIEANGIDHSERRYLTRPRHSDLRTRFSVICMVEMEDGVGGEYALGGAIYTIC